MSAPVPLPVFDGPLDAEGLSDADLETLRLFGVEAALIAPPPLPVSDAREARARLERLLTHQLPRFARAGIRAWATLGLSGQSVPERGLHEVLDVLPELCAGGRAVAIGPLDLAGRGGAVEEAFDTQVALAGRLELPLLVNAGGAALSPTVARLQAGEQPPRRTLLLRLDEAGARVALGLGFYAGLSLHPAVQSLEQAIGAVRRLGARKVVLGNPSGGGDLLALPRAAHRMEKEGLSEALISRVGGLNLAALLRLPGV
ncbi:MAG TPA: hypothetical protein VK013_14535 [Myxococcaceae bacterium]|nr:hypothetical protein [Myxococcaceae bacterium]